MRNVEQDVRPLSGSLDRIPVFNSNSPEVVENDGILLSTFPTERSTSREQRSHLDYVFENRFDVFAHHISNAERSRKKGELHLGLMVGNTEDKPVHFCILSGASYLSRPDAPFKPLPPQKNNDDGDVYSGPGDRVTNDVLRDRKPKRWETSFVVPPHDEILIKNLPIPVSRLRPQLNGRSTLLHCQCDGKVRLALLARFAKAKPKRSTLSLIFAPFLMMSQRRKFRPPDEEEYLETLARGVLVQPRDTAPTPPGEERPLRYGRVSGVALGSTWTTSLTDEGQEFLSAPPPGKAFSYVISSLPQGAFGCGQVQSAPMAVRYPDTAYQAHGNYGIKYDLSFPLKNTGEKTLLASISLDTPIKSDVKGKVTFSEPVYPNVFFRGTIKVSTGPKDFHYVHVVQHRGEKGAPLVTVPIQAGAVRTIRVELIYPPDSTPPQLLTVSTVLDIQ